MLNNIDDLVEINLNLIANSQNQSVFRNKFIDEKGHSLNFSDRFADYMESKMLIDVEVKQRWRCDLTKLGLEVFNSGGWKKYLEANKLLQEKELAESKYREKLEIELAESNLEANKLNKKIAKHNQRNEKKNLIATWINVGIGLINIGLFNLPYFEKQKLKL